MRNFCCLFVVVILAAACAEPGGAQKPELRAGVSVEMAGTQHAVAMPEADGPDAVIVAVTQKGNVYLGITPRSPAQLTEELKKIFAGRSSKSVYVKADTRVGYASVARVLAATREAGVESAYLLTAQALPADTPSYALPKGLRVSASAAPASAIRASARGEAPGSVALSIEGSATTMAQLRADLAKAVQGQRGRGVSLSADGALSYGDVVRVADECVGAGVGVTLATPSR
ncbi:MAG: biopolymer transporter ExbD [Bryobacterales bacterium]|nr:biopolymer transporter ExbD [Bryobacterales bacterium]